MTRPAERRISRNRMVEWLQPFLDKRWFILWLPLRAPEHWLAGTDKACEPIRDEDCSSWPSEQLVGRDAPRHLASILPFRRTVVSVQGFEYTAAGCKDLFNVACQRHLAPEHRDLPKGTMKPVSAQLTVSGTTTVTRKGIAEGWESMLDDNEVNRLKDDGGWPRRPTLAQSRRGVPEKNEPHCGVYFVWLEGGDLNQLSIHWAQFLPISEPAKPIP